MSDFATMIDCVFKLEGFYSDDPYDKGGATCLGWTLETAKSTRDLDKDGDIDIEDIKILDMDHASSAYRNHFYDDLELFNFSDKIAYLLLDMSVNHGKWRALILLARALNELGCDYDVNELKKIKSFESLKAKCLDKMIEDSSNVDRDKLIESLISVRIQFYKDIVTAKPSQKRFLKGWLNRVEMTKVNLLYFE